MMVVLKMLAFVVYAFAFFMGVPLAIVGTCVLVTHWLGTAWWVGLVLAPITLIEFGGALAFVEWDDNPIVRWLDI